MSFSFDTHCPPSFILHQPKIAEDFGQLSTEAMYVPLFYILEGRGGLPPLLGSPISFGWISQ
jgi:hypothetical protein